MLKSTVISFEAPPESGLNMTFNDIFELAEVSTPETASSSFIVITGFDDSKYRECCKKYGVLAFLRKPVDGEALLDIIKYNFSHVVNS